jgi:hypothetical protein
MGAAREHGHNQDDYFDQVDKDKVSCTPAFQRCKFDTEVPDRQ